MAAKTCRPSFSDSECGYHGMRVDRPIRFEYATCGRGNFLVRTEKVADSKIPGYVLTVLSDILVGCTGLSWRPNLSCLLSIWCFTLIIVVDPTWTLVNRFVETIDLFLNCLDKAKSLLDLFIYSFLISNVNICFSRTMCCWCSWQQNAAILFVWRYS